MYRVMLILVLLVGCEAPQPIHVDTSSRDWAVSGDVLYGNEFAAGAGAIPAPYILGGMCVAPPTQATLDRYQRAGLLRGVTLSELQEAYRVEGIVWDTQVAGGIPGLHVLEGGNALFTPLPGTLGYVRLFGREHPPYRPKSELVKNWSASLKPELAAYREPKPGMNTGGTVPIEPARASNESH